MADTPSDLLRALVFENARLELLRATSDAESLADDAPAEAWADGDRDGELDLGRTANLEKLKFQVCFSPHSHQPGRVVLVDIADF